MNHDYMHIYLIVSTFEHIWDCSLLQIIPDSLLKLHL